LSTVLKRTKAKKEREAKKDEMGMLFDAITRMVAAVDGAFVTS
jgi:hypothetical protein